MCTRRRVERVDDSLTHLKGEEPVDVDVSCERERAERRALKHRQRLCQGENAGSATLLSLCNHRTRSPIGPWHACDHARGWLPQRLRRCAGTAVALVAVETLAFSEFEQSTAWILREFVGSSSTFCSGFWEESY